MFLNLGYWDPSEIENIINATPELIKNNQFDKFVTLTHKLYLSLQDVFEQNQMDNQEFKIIQNVYNQFNLYYGHIAEKVPGDIKTKIMKKFKVKGSNFDQQILLENLKKLKD